MERPVFKRTWVLILLGVVIFLVLFLAVTVATVWTKDADATEATKWTSAAMVVTSGEVA